MEENRQVTPLEGLEMAVNQLNAVNVPTLLTEQISIPIARAVDLIKKCIPFLVEKAPEPPKEEPEIKILEAESEEPGEEADG